MMKSNITKILTLTVAFCWTAIAGFSSHLSGNLQFSAKLSGDQEVPSVSTNAQGVASIILNQTSDTMFVNIAVNGLSGPITGIHVHQGKKGTNGGVLNNLTSFVEGNRIVTALTGSNLTPAIISAYLAGETYVNVHTAANPNGEIRGQVGLETDWGFRADLDTTQQTHSVSNNATGVAVFNLNHKGDKIKFWVAADGLSGAITAAHLHYGKTNTNGGVAVNLSTMISGNTISGTINAGSVVGLVDSMLAGSIYLNVHTSANPNGEVRGQVWLDKGLAFDAYIDPSQEVTAPTGATGSGVAYVSLNTTLDTLWYSVQAEGLTGAITGAHIHDGEKGVDGGVLLNMTANVVGNRIEGIATGMAINPILIGKMLIGNTYINIHTSANAAGEIRGQIYRLAREGYAYTFEGEQEIPSLFTVAKGAGMVSIDRDQTNAHYMMVVSDLTGPITGAHFHLGVEGTNGGVLYNISTSFAMSGNDDAAFGYWDDSSTPAFAISNSAQFRGDSVYVNLHTTLNPGGELRGQVLRGARKFEHRVYENGVLPIDPKFTSNILFSTKLTGDQEVPAVTTTAAGVGGFLLNKTRDTLWVNLAFDGLSDTITGIHIHEAAMGANGAVVTDLGPWLEQNRVRGYLTSFDLNKFVTGAYYVNVHTDANPGGEIRGQITAEAPTTFMADINGMQEVPAVTTNAMGMGVFNLSKDEKNLEIKIVATGLSGKITGAHLHMAAAGSNGGVVENLTAMIKGNYIVANVDPTAYLTDLKAGNVYINVHTDANAGGEIRGQLDVSNAMMFDAWLNGAQEVPASFVPGAGVAAAWYNSSWDTLYYKVVVDNISGAITGAHFHNAGLGANGGVEVGITSAISGKKIEGFVTGTDLDADFQDKLLWGQLYLNLHTDAYASGELRGQVNRTAHDGFTFDLCGAQEVPAVEVDGYGAAIVSVDREHKLGHVMFASTELSGAITGAHLHSGAKGANGGVLYNLTASISNNNGYTYLPVDSTGVALMKNQDVYLNIHTAANANGEIRGQLDEEWDCPALKVAEDTLSVSELNGYGKKSALVFPNPANNVLNIKLTEGNLNSVKLINISGSVIAESNSTENETVFNVSELEAGMYILQVASTEGTSVHRVVIR